MGSTTNNGDNDCLLNGNGKVLCAGLVGFCIILLIPNSIHIQMFNQKLPTHMPLNYLLCALCSYFSHEIIKHSKHNKIATNGGLSQFVASSLKV